MTTEEIVKLAISSVLPLIGVIIGGYISFYIQKLSLDKTHAFEREKIRLDNIAKDEEEKFKAYNRVLLNSGTHKIHEYDRHTGGELNYQKYAQYVRPILFPIFHLLDKEVSEELLKIEYIYEKLVFEEEGGVNNDKEQLRSSYIKIIKIILQKYKEQHELNKMGN